MASNSGERINESIRLELESARISFHTLLDSLSEEDLRAKSNNPGWTNGEILFHMTLGFIIVARLLPLAKFFSHLPKGYSRAFAWMLNAMTAPFNWINAAGVRGGGRIYNGKKIGRKFDKVMDGLLKKLTGVKDNEWQSGMYYPTKWDALFSEFMTIEKLFQYPVTHFRFHIKQISSGINQLPQK